MKMHNLQERSRQGYTTWGCLWEKGLHRVETPFYVISDAGKHIPVQNRILAYWPDGSLKWTAHTADAGKLGESFQVVSGEMRSALDETPDCIRIWADKKGWHITNGFFEFDIPKTGKNLAEKIHVQGKEVISFIDSLLLLEEREEKGYECRKETKHFASWVDKVTLLEEGPLQFAVKYEGTHILGGESKIPFCIYMTIGAGEKQFHFTYTFFYDGDENKDFLKGIGLHMEVPLTGALYNRHVKIKGDYGFFKESVVQLLGGKRFPWSVYDRQMKEERLSASDRDMEAVEGCMDYFPHWDTYELCQDSPSHFRIRKKTGEENCCYVNSLDGRRTEGAASFGSEKGSLLLGMKDFWQKYPSGCHIRGLAGDKAEAIVWIWTPETEAFDFRHYTNNGYSQIYYEGFPFKGADPYGIGCTNEIIVGYSEKMIPGDEEIAAFGEMVSRPPRYVGEPKYYHQLKAFGNWSLVKKETEKEREIEETIEKITEFYLQEVEQRNWYGLFDYGDVMHTYDSYRHVWRYDMGGFAWDNTELIPDYWLWYSFLRTGRADIFSMAERMTRHCSEVDTYHFGPLKGMGSRHNVRHWGCSCKELRIAMAGHNRFYYYLTGDYRLGDVLDEVAESELTLKQKDPLGFFYEKTEENRHLTHARSGPDWSSLCANWMTRWERYQDKEALYKILTGIDDIKKAPLKLVSGPDFAFDADSCHLFYIGERATGGTHLQICMGAAQIWMELADLLEDAEWREMLVTYGWFYFLDKAEQERVSNGLITKEREFSLPMLASGIGAFSAAAQENKELAEKIWKGLFLYVDASNENDHFAITELTGQGNRKILKEMPKGSTNNSAQWCLNTIVCLELISKYL